MCVCVRACVRACVYTDKNREKEKRNSSAVASVRVHTALRPGLRLWAVFPAMGLMSE